MSTMDLRGSWMLGGALALGLGLLSPFAHAGKLSDMRDKTHKTESSSSTDDKGEDDDDDDDHDHEDDDGGRALGKILLALFRGAANAGGGGTAEGAQTVDTSPGPEPFFARYPYADGHRGAMAFRARPWQGGQQSLRPVPCPPEDPLCAHRTEVETCVDGVCYARDQEQAPAPSTHQPSKLRSGRYQVFSDVSHDLDGLGRYSVGAAAEASVGLGLEGRWSYWRETLEEGGTDALWLGDFALVLRIFGSRAVQSYLGGGMRFMLDRSGQEDAYGFHGAWSLEAYPYQPMAFRIAADAGNLGDAFYLESQVSLGALISRVELYAGYQLALIDAISAHGPALGVRLHL